MWTMTSRTHGPVALPCTTLVPKKRPPNMEFQKEIVLVALKNNNLNTLFYAECVIFCTFLDVKCFSKMASNILYLL